MSGLKTNRKTIGKELVRPKCPFNLPEYARAEERRNHLEKYQDSVGIQWAMSVHERGLMTDREFLAYARPPIEGCILEPQVRVELALRLLTLNLTSKQNAKSIINRSLHEHVDQTALRGTLLLALDHKVITKKELSTWFHLPQYHSLPQYDSCEV